MNTKITFKTRATPGNSLTSWFKPTEAWSAILSLIVFSLLCLVTGGGEILNLAFPLGAFSVGLFLYLRYPLMYVGFTWWVWFLSPLLRRLVDYQAGFTDPSPILLSPILVTFISAISLWQNLPKVYIQESIPFIISMVGVIYGFIIGIFNRAAVPLIIGLLDWFGPIVFAFYLFVNWRNYPLIRQNFQRVFTWAVLVTGVYGIIQYLIAPQWDRLWLVNTGLTTMGHPEPLGIRVWSTMSASGPFANFMFAGLILLLSDRSFLKIPASVVGYLSFLLTLVRSAWGSWLIALTIFITSVSLKRQIRLILILCLLMILVIPLANTEPFAEEINSRLETFGDLGSDGSADARAKTYSRLISTALTSLVGTGIGEMSLDNSLLDLLIYLGWIGTVFYLGGMLIVLFSIFQGVNNLDSSALSYRAIAMGIILRLPLGPVIIEMNGLLLWSFLAMAAAAKMYHKSLPARSSYEKNPVKLYKSRY